MIDDLAEDVDHPSATPIGASNDSVRQYLNEIGRVALLEPEEEVDLAKRDRAGRAAHQMLVAPEGLTVAQRRRLRAIAEDGVAAHDRMIRANLRLVVSLARRYLGRGLSLLELIQEGNLGLIRGVEKFDHAMGYKFSTYATWWIRQALTRGTANKARAVRLPVHVHEMVAKIRRAELDLLQVTGIEPDDEEVADMLGLRVERLREIRSAGRDVTSLDRPVGEDGDATLADLLADERAIDPERAASFSATQARISEVLQCLDERERGVISLRYGLVDGEVHTLEQIGEVLGVTRERIRQIEKRTLAKLRQPARARRLEGMLDSASLVAEN